MSLKNHFKKKESPKITASPQKEFFKIAADILGVTATHYANKNSHWDKEIFRYTYKYDFSLRLLTIDYKYDSARTSSRDLKFPPQNTVVPFSQLDKEVLAFLHEQLIELEGAPPPLPGHMNKPSIGHQIKIKK